MRDLLTRWLQLAWFMLPAYCGNMAPPLVRYWHGWNAPIHERWLGAHKTVMGFLAGVFAGILASGLQSVTPASAALLDYRYWPLIGLGFGFGAMAGDALKSFVKRRIGIAPGARWVPFDQLDFAVGALCLLGPFAHLRASDVAAILLMTFCADIVVNRLAFRVGIKDRPW